MFATIMGILAEFLPGIFGKAVDGVVTIEQSKISAQSDQAKLDEALSEHQLGAQVSIAQTNAQVVIAEQEHWFTRCIRPAFAMPLIIYWGQCIADKTVLTWFGIHHSTDDLGPTLLAIAMLVLTSYFGPIAINAIRSR